MATISVSLPSDGQTIDAADYNTPISTIVTEINGSLDSDNIAASGVVPNNILTGTGTSWVWQDWTPSYSNIIEGNGTVVAKYIQIGKTVHYRYRLTLGSTSGVGTTATISLPVTSVDYAVNTPIGECIYTDANGSVYNGAAMLVTTTTLVLRVNTASTTFTTVTGTSSTIPFTWTTSDVVSITGTYEAA
jgi:hypothetical protein